LLLKRIFSPATSDKTKNEAKPTRASRRRGQVEKASEEQEVAVSSTGMFSKL